MTESKPSLRDLILLRRISESEILVGGVILAINNIFLPWFQKMPAQELNVVGIAAVATALANIPVGLILTMHIEDIKSDEIINPKANIPRE